MTYSDTLNADDQWACHRKKAYPDEKTAKKVANRINNEKGANLVSYGCGRCGRWHVGRKIHEFD